MDVDLAILYERVTHRADHLNAMETGVRNLQDGDGKNAYGLDAPLKIHSLSLVCVPRAVSEGRKFVDSTGCDLWVTLFASPTDINCRGIPLRGLRRRNSLDPAAKTQNQCGTFFLGPS